MNANFGADDICTFEGKYFIQRGEIISGNFKRGRLESFLVCLRKAEGAVRFFGVVLVGRWRGRIEAVIHCNAFDAVRSADFHEGGFAGNESAGRGYADEDKGQDREYLYGLAHFSPIYVLKAGQYQ